MGPPLTLPLIPLPGWLATVQAAAGHAVLQAVVNGVNPSSDHNNCGHIIDAAIDRLSGANPNAVAPPGTDGSFPEIEARHHTSIAWNSSFADAFDAVRNGGHGTMAIVGIDYGGGQSPHVVVMANQHGSVGIIEGQDGGPGAPPELITDPARANDVYGINATSNVGFGIVGSNP